MAQSVARKAKQFFRTMNTWVKASARKALLLGTTAMTLQGPVYAKDGDNAEDATRVNANRAAKTEFMVPYMRWNYGIEFHYGDEDPVLSGILDTATTTEGIRQGVGNLLGEPVTKGTIFKHMSETFPVFGPRIDSIGYSVVRKEILEGTLKKTNGISFECPVPGGWSRVVITDPYGMRETGEDHTAVDLRSRGDDINGPGNGWYLVASGIQKSKEHGNLGFFKVSSANGEYQLSYGHTDTLDRKKYPVGYKFKSNEVVSRTVPTNYFGWSHSNAMHIHFSMFKRVRDKKGNYNYKRIDPTPFVKAKKGMIERGSDNLEFMPETTAKLKNCANPKIFRSVMAGKLASNPQLQEDYDFIAEAIQNEASDYISKRIQLNREQQDKINKNYTAEMTDYALNLPKLVVQRQETIRKQKANAVSIIEWYYPPGYWDKDEPKLTPEQRQQRQEEQRPVQQYPKMEPSEGRKLQLKNY